MKQRIITISNNGRVSVPDNVQMRDFEMAELFGVYHQTIRANIKAVLKSGIITSNCDIGGAIIGSTIIPDYHGFDMVMALAFRIQSYKAEIFRKWIIRKMTTTECQPIVLQYNYQTICTSERN